MFLGYFKPILITCYQKNKQMSGNLTDVSGTTNYLVTSRQEQVQRHAPQYVSSNNYLFLHMPWWLFVVNGDLDGHDEQ